MDKPDAHDPMPRDERGWNVAPAPDGRGLPARDERTAPHRTRSFLVIVAIVIGLNLALSLLLRPEGQPRVQVPFNPVFLQQVQAGHVKSITARNDAIQGTFTTKLRFPAGDRSARPTTLFKTQVPSFWSHALVGMLTPSADPVRKVSIIPRGVALGVTLATPDADRVSYAREDLEAKIRVALGGRVAEEIVYGTATTGAESDLEQLTAIARRMVGRWGMSSRIGPITVLPADGGPLLPGSNEASETTRRLVDDEVRRLVDAAHQGVDHVLRAHRGQLDNLKQALLESETLDAADAYAAAGVPMREPEAIAPTNGDRPGRRKVGTGERAS